MVVEHPLEGEYTGFFDVFGFGEIATLVGGIMLGSFLHGYIQPKIYDMLEDDRNSELLTSGILLTFPVGFAFARYRGMLPEGDVADFFANVFAGIMLSEIGNIVEELTTSAVATT